MLRKLELEIRNQRRIWPQTAQGGLVMPSDALAAPHIPPIREIRPRGGTQKSVEGRWTHHVRCFFVPLTHRPDVCGWFGRWGRLGLRHQGGPLVSGRRDAADARLENAVVQELTPPQAMPPSGSSYQNKCRSQRMRFGTQNLRGFRDTSISARSRCRHGKTSSTTERSGRRC